MSVNIEESDYRIVRNHDPQFQAMTRITDTNNVYDIRQEYIKDGETRNDFAIQKEMFNRNIGILNDGKYIDMSSFFTETIRVGETSIVGKTIEYFKFKTNHVLNANTTANIKDTYIDKTNVESIYDIKTNLDTNGKETYSLSDEKQLIENVYNSYPLQRVDKLSIYELDSLFVYINGKKIPDNEIFVYANKSFTDVFIPQKYIPGDINDKSSRIEAVFNIDYRQPGSEMLYFRNNVLGNSITIDLTDDKYQYRYKQFPLDKLTKDKIVMFVNGVFTRIQNVSVSNNIITVSLNETLNADDVELYVLGNIVYRHYTPTESQLNNSGSKVHFYLPDDYFVDVLSGPITKSAISFFYKGQRVDDSKITQTSRFSFEYTVDNLIYKLYDKKYGVNSNLNYYTKDETTGKFYPTGKITEFEDSVVYYYSEPAESFDETAIDFFIEDIGFKIDEYGYTIYGDDYYLLNMLGVKRCVDRMKGSLSYSIFDNPLYNISFREVLSKDGDLFDVQKAIDKYTYISRNTHSPIERVKYLISQRPTLIRRLFERFKIPSKKAIVYGNTKDVVFSSVTKLKSTLDEEYYKIYVNHLLLESDKYSIVRELDHDVITIKKEVLEPLVGNSIDGYTSGVNRIEIFQYNLTYRSKTIFKDNINNNFEQRINPSDGTPIYRKTYLTSQLPFDENLLADDICAIEKVNKSWFDNRDDEYYYYYPTSDNSGYRMVKYFKVIEKTEDHLTIDIGLHIDDPLKTNGYFFIMGKQYNVIEETIFDNSDGTYMEQNDLMIPIYNDYIEYGLDESGNRIITGIDKYIPYINNSEPIICCNGMELIYGKDYTFINPEKNPQLASSYIILKKQPKDGSRFVVQFNSSKTNILIVGYDDLEIDNNYGLVYLSELPYPLSPEYMNIYVNGEKLSSYDLDILSDKLVRFKNITRPIRSILITTNSKYKNSEIQDFIDLYHPSEFEKLLSDIFWNCDPSKKVDANHPDINMVYKVNPYYKEFTDFDGDVDEFKANNPYYVEYVNDIIENGYKYNNNTIFETKYPKPVSTDEDYEQKLDAWNKVSLFFEVYKHNHGFEPYVDSILQAENPWENTASTFVTDSLEIMYLNWLARSKKTRTYGWKDENIDNTILKFFSVYENVIIDNRLDIVIDAGKEYDGLDPKVINEIYDTDEHNQIIIKYPGMSFDLKRQWFFETMIEVIEKHVEEETIEKIQNDPETGESPIFKEICDHKNSNILYPVDFEKGIEPDKNGIIWTGTDVDICASASMSDSENELLQAAIQAENEIRNR